MAAANRLWLRVGPELLEADEFQRCHPRSLNQARWQLDERPLGGIKLRAVYGAIAEVVAFLASPRCSCSPIGGPPLFYSARTFPRKFPVR
jgi:hypothetical protein